MPLTSYSRVEKRSPNAPKVTTYYDTQGRILKTVTESLNDGSEYGNTQDVISLSLYDEYGRNVAKSEPYFTNETSKRVWSTTEYDPIGRQVKATTPSGVVATMGYHGRFQSTKKEFTDGSPTQIEVAQVNSQGNIIRAWNPGGSGTEVDEITSISTSGADVLHEYDAVGNLLRTKVNDGGTFKQVVSNDYGSKGYFKESTTDNAMGTWTYEYDALGRLRKQTDAKNQTTTIAYDKLNRVTEKLIGGVSSKFYYYDNTNEEGSWVGSLKRTVQHIGNSSSAILTQEGFYYDAFGRSLINIQEIDEKYYYTHFKYDEDTHQLRQKTHYWRPKALRSDYTTKSYIWQSFATIYDYNSRGAVTRVYDSQGKTWWYAPKYDHRGRVESFINGNGIITSKNWDDDDQTLTDIDSTFIGSKYQDWVFDFDDRGNLKSRTDNRSVSGFSSQSESFLYDTKNRLTHVNGSEVASYDTMGNLQSKTGFGSATTNGSYSYSVVNGLNTRLNTISSSGLDYAYSYDANGNITARYDGLTVGANPDYEVSWSAFNKPLEIKREGNYSRFVYNANQSRVISISKENTSVKKQLYIIAGMEQIEYATSANGGSYTNSSQWESWSWDVQTTRIYISGPTGMIGSFDYKFDQPASTAINRYWYHFDHQGSIDLITGELPSTNTNGGILPPVLASMSYDVWGLPRADAKNWSNGGSYASPDTFNNPAADITDRGYTKHEMLAETGLIHMNGRIYDPLAGRFLSPDPHIQFPNLKDNFNRYSYVLNNPLSYTDPSGYFLSGLKNFFKKFWRPILAIVVAVVTAGALAATLWNALGGLQIGLAQGISLVFSGALGPLASIGIGAISGFMGGLVATGTLKGGLIGAFTGAAAAGIGAYFSSTGAEATFGSFTELARATAHGISGGVASELGGGKFGSGFFSSFVSSLAYHTTPIKNMEYGFQRVAATAVVGGTTSVIGGGKFANGAVTSAFQAIFNGEVSRRSQGRQKNVNGISSPVENFFRKGKELVVNAIVDPLAPGSEIVAAIEGAGDLFVDGSLTLSFGGSAHNGFGATLDKGVYLSWDFSSFSDLKFDVGEFFTLGMGMGGGAGTGGTFGFYNEFDISGRSGTVQGGAGLFGGGMTISDNGVPAGLTFSIMLSTPYSGSINALTVTKTDSFFD